MSEKDKRARKVQGKESKKPLLDKKLLTISIMLAVVIIFGAVIWRFLSQSSESEVKFSLKAAIIDQLSEDANLRNPAFVKEITAILNESGFSVSYHNYTETNVTFFRGLAKANYGIIILRVHAALREGDSTVDFFTSEPYRSDMYVKEQNERLLVNGTIFYPTRRHYFAFSSKFVERLEGTFPQSIVIAMGCQTLNQTAGQPMAKAFCDVKKAKVYIGWSSWVSVQHSDEEIIKLMKRLLRENKTIRDAVGNASQDPYWGAYLKFYPESARDLKILDLIGEARISTYLVKFAMFEGFSINQIESVNRFNSLATVTYSWFRRFSPVKFALFNLPISSAKNASSKTSFIHLSKSPRYR